jgi:YVTN family beta-propeller protein
MKTTGSRPIANAPDGTGNKVDDRHKHPCTRARVSAWRRAFSAGAIFSLLALVLPPTAFAGTSAVTTVMAYVSDEGDVAVIDVATGHKIKNINLPQSSWINSGGSYSTQPGYIAVAPNQQTAYVTTLNSLVPINLLTNTAETPIPLGVAETNGGAPGTAGHVVISPDGNTAYVTDWTGGNVIAINLQSGTHTNIKVGSRPTGVAITPNGNTLVVANYGSDNVSVINLSTNQVTRTLSLPSGAAPEGVAVTPDGSSAYVSESKKNDLASINLSNSTVSNNAIAVNNGTWDIAITPDGSKAYITDSNTVVTPFDLTHAQPETAISSSLYHPTGVAVSPDGKWAYVTDYGFGGQVTPINVATNTPSSPIATGPYSLGVAFATITQQASTLSVSLSGTKPSGGNGVYSTPVKVTINTTNSSNPTKYSLDGGNTWQTYGGPVTVSAAGQHTLTYGWADVGGTVYTEGSTSFDIGQLAPDLTTATVGPGSIGSQTTTKVRVTPETQGDTFAYVLGNSPAASPFLGDPLKTGTKPYISNTDINNVNAGQYLDIYEVNSQNQVQAWHEFQLSSNDIQLAVGAATVVPTKTTVLSGEAVTVTGVVYDVYEHVVPGAKVTLTSSVGSWQTPSVTTDASGLYSDTWIAPTTWTNTNATVTASVYGTNPAVQKQATIQIEAATTGAPTGIQHSYVTQTGWMESWGPVSGATSYDVYLNNTKIGSVTQDVYNFTGQQPGTTYRVQVSSVNAFGQASALSAPDSVSTTVHGPIPPTIITEFFPEPAQIGQAYSGQVRINGGMMPMNWIITSGTLPPGLRLTTQGVISGTPTSAGNYTFTVKVTDGNSLSSSKQLTLVVNGTTATGSGSSNSGGSSTSPPISVTSGNDQAARLGQPYHQTLQATGGQTPYTWSIVGGTLPVGLTMNPNTGVISGTPSQTGVYHVTIQVKGADGTTSNKTITVDLLRSNQREVLWNGTPKNVPDIVRMEGTTPTTYMPIWYVMQLLKPMGITSTWDGKEWHMTTSSTPELSNIPAGSGKTGIYLNGTLVQEVTTVAATDASTGKATTYMPIWYVMQLLKRVGLQSTWNGATWTVTK